MAWQPRFQSLQNDGRMKGRVSEEFSITLLYHDVFDYALRERELKRWQAGRLLKLNSPRPRVETKDGYYFLRGRERLLPERMEKESVSREKMKLLSGVKHVFEGIDSVLMVGITGSLAMASARKTSDIDLMFVVRSGRLWMTRARVLFSLLRHKVAIRRAKEEKEQDRLCLNIWIDERDLAIAHPRNAYTAHELAQIIPLINRENAYERLLASNRWILDYWPNAVRVYNFDLKVGRRGLGPGLAVRVIEKVAYVLQRVYMSHKVTREVVAPTRAFFHPFDWSVKMAAELKKRGVGQINNGT